MNAIEFMKEKKRMCKSYSSCTEACPLRKPMDENRLTCLGYCFEYPEKAADIVERWSAEHPVKTRQSEFLKMFPNARLDEEGTISICPRAVNSTFVTNGKCWPMTCHQCRREYWLVEVE